MVLPLLHGSALRRHIAQVKLNCEVGDVDCRPRQMNRSLHGPTTHEIFDAPPSAARAMPLSIPGKTKPCNGTTEYQ